MVGTAGDRFSIKVPASEESWVATRVRAELIKRELAAADELPIDEAGEAALAAKEASKTGAVAAAAAKKEAARKAAASPRRKAAAELEAAEHHVRLADLKRQHAAVKVSYTKLAVKQAKTETKLRAAQQLVAEAPVPIQAKLEAFMSRPRPVV